MIGVLVVNFLIIYRIQRKSLDMKKKYPQQDCNEFEFIYENQYEQWKREAIKEYQVNTAIEEDDGFALYSGPLQCFCKFEKKNKVAPDKLYELTSLKS